ncbi:MAG TPA: M48 family metallopeptidase [Allosphingosinicella sp.]
MAILAGQGAAAAVPEPARSAPQLPPILALRALDQRVAEVGFRLSTANAALCRDLQWQPGWVVHDLSQYARRNHPEAIAAFGFADGPSILALVPGGPADRAGLRPDDVLFSADNVPLPKAPAAAHDTFAPTERILEALEAALADGSAELRIRRGTASLTLRLNPVRGCASRFQLIPSDRADARANGQYVQLTSAMVEFARDDHELAAFIAHELAHNVLRHRLRLNAAGVERGLLANFGRSARLFRETELEADRMAIYLMERAGFDPRAAVRLWVRQSQNASRFPSSGTHPAWSARIAAMEAEIQAIARLKAERREVRPPAFEGELPPGA